MEKEEKAIKLANIEELTLKILENNEIFRELGLLKNNCIRMKFVTKNKKTKYKDIIKIMEKIKNNEIQNTI